MSASLWPLHVMKGLGEAEMRAISSLVTFPHPVTVQIQPDQAQWDLQHHQYYAELPPGHPGHPPGPPRAVIH